jgi:hypothetical protein
MTAALARESATTAAAALARNLEAATAQARMPSCDYVGHPRTLCHGYLDLLHGREEEENQHEEDGDGAGGKEEDGGACVAGSEGSERMKRSPSVRVSSGFQ